MADDRWVTLRLGTICTKIGSGATPRGGSDVYLDNGPYALVRSQNVHNDGFHYGGLAFIEEKHAAELCNVEVKKDDVLLNITGDSVARCCQVDPSILPARVNQHVAIIRTDPDKLNTQFLRYLLISPEMQARLLSWAGSGGTRNALTKGMIESLEVLVPENVAEQHAIAYILGTLDDKIELNRRMSETLELTARALFKSWFVNFDPVRAKAEGRDTGLPNPFTELFPDRFEDSELGEIPAEWRVVTVGELGEIICGKTPPTADKENYGGNILFITIPDMHNKVFITQAETRLTAKGAETQPNKLLPKHSICVSCIATPGLVVITSEPSHTNQQINSIICNSVTSPYWCYLAMTSIRQKIITGGAGGSATLNLNKAEFSKLQLVRPDNETMQRFHNSVEPIFSRIRSNDLENMALSTIRDTLLPKLTSGKLRVKDAERFIKEKGL